MKNRMKRIVDLQRITEHDIRVASVPRMWRAMADVLKQSARAKEMRAQWTTNFENVYRVMITPNTGCVEVVCLGIDSVDSEAEGTYSDSSQLPAWMQEKLAVLSMMKVDPPQTKVEGVGMRIDDDVFWVIKGERA
jgi:hypothetical protein